MSQTTMTVRLSGELSDFVANNISENGSYENISEYVRGLIRKDKERSEKEKFEKLKAELALAFSAPDSSLIIDVVNYFYQKHLVRLL